MTNYTTTIIAPNKCNVAFLILILCLTFVSASKTFAQRPGENMVPFQGTTIDGQIINSNQFIEQGPLMLVFWASWCPNCLREIPRIKHLLQTTTGKNLQVITINIGYNDSLPRINRFIEKTKMTYPVILDHKTALTSAYQVLGVPTLFITDQEGTILYRQHVVPDENILKQILP